MVLETRPPNDSSINVRIFFKNDKIAKTIYFRLLVFREGGGVVGGGLALIIATCGLFQ